MTLQDLAMTFQDLATTFQDLATTLQDLATTLQDLATTPSPHWWKLSLMLDLTLGGELVEVILESREFFQNPSQRQSV